MIPITEEMFFDLDDDGNKRRVSAEDEAAIREMIAETNAATEAAAKGPSDAELAEIASFDDVDAVTAAADAEAEATQAADEAGAEHDLDRLASLWLVRELNEIAANMGHKWSRKGLIEREKIAELCEAGWVPPNR